MLDSPSVMVSSTLYDLKQIRTDLSQFISDDIGYIPLMSELPSFPINPDLNTIDNCCKRVENNVDIFVLIIGGRYGSIDHGCVFRRKPPPDSDSFRHLIPIEVATQFRSIPPPPGRGGR